MKDVMELKGTNGQLEFYKDKVIIKRNGFGGNHILGSLKETKQFI